MRPWALSRAGSASVFEPACELLFAVRDEGGGQLVVLDGRGLPPIAGSAETLVLLDGHAGEEGGLLVLILGDLELGGLLRGKSRLPVVTGSSGPVWPIVTFATDMALASFAWLVT